MVNRQDKSAKYMQNQDS